MPMDLRNSKFPPRIKLYFPSVRGRVFEWEVGEKIPLTKNQL